MPTKRKLELFDPNKSDSNDTDFEPNQPSTKKSRNQFKKRARNSRKRSKRARYQGSDVSDDDNEDSLLEESFSSSSQEDEELELNPATGRVKRKATKKTVSYEEDSESDIAEVTGDIKPIDSQLNLQKNDRLRQLSNEKEAEDKDNDVIDEEVVGDLKPIKTRTRIQTRMVTLKIGTSHRGLRSGGVVQTLKTGPSLELISSGNSRVDIRAHMKEGDEVTATSVPSEECYRSPEPTFWSRPTRGSKGLKKTASSTEEELQEISSCNPEAEDTTMVTEFAGSDDPEDAKEESYTAAPNEDDSTQLEVSKTAHVDKVGNDDDEDDDDFPTKRRRKSSGLNFSAVTPEETRSKSKSTPRRFTRGLKSKRKNGAEVGSDFEPPEEATEDELTNSDPSPKKKVKGLESESSPGQNSRRTGRKKSKSGSRRCNSPGSADDELDQDEIAEELHDLKQTSRRRRRLRRENSEVLYERTGRARNKVDYTIKPLDQIYAADDDAENAAPTPTKRATGGRNGTSQPWERCLFSTFGPFGGGGGPSPVIVGPWGTGAIGVTDSDSSDDETIQKTSGITGAVGMTPTSGAAPGLLPGLCQTSNLDVNGGGLSGSPANLGKIKSQKSLADADPLGVDQYVDFSKVGGLQNHIDQLKEMVQMPLLYPELFLKFHVTPPRGVLFHGPPGTGKTLLARALAASVGSRGQKITFYMRKGADALSKWVGEAERQLRLLFEEARKTQPSIIFFDEIDGLAPVRSSKQEQIHASIVSTLLALMDGMDGRGQVIVIGATNRPDNVDPALRRPGRFDREFYFPLPGVDARKSILNIHTKDWGLDDNFKDSLANVTKGYGGADLRALCTEAALNAIQRTYPQIYSSNDKLKIDAEKIKVTAKDFMLSVQKIVPSSERSTSTGATPLPKAIEPLLRDQLKQIESILDGLIPLKKKTTALQEAMFEQYDDEDHGFGREKMQRDFEKSRVFRPRLLIQGEPGMGQAYLGGAILNHFEGLHVQSFDLPTIFSDSNRSPEATLVQLFAEVKRHKPSVIYLPSVEIWYHTLSEAAITTFLGLLRAIPPTDPILVLGITDMPSSKVDPDLLRNIFGFSRQNCFTINRPSRASRQKFFASIGEYVKKSPTEFPEPLNRKKRKLEVLELAPTPTQRAPTKEEILLQKKKDHQLLNLLKVAIQPIMDQIQKKYKKFRAPVIPHNLIRYIFDEKDPDFVRSDICGDRPYEIDTDKDGVTGLREVASGKFFYNLETTTIEERLSNGFYARPKDFLADIRSLAKDAKRIGDKERTLKAQELLANVEVDVALIEQNPVFSDCENLFLRQLKRFKEKEEKSKRRTIEKKNSDSFTACDAAQTSEVIQNEIVTSSIQTPGSKPITNSLVNGNTVNGEICTASESTEDVIMGGIDNEPLPSTQPSIPGYQANNVAISGSARRLIHLSQQSAVFKDTSNDLSSQELLSQSNSTCHTVRKSSGSWNNRTVNGRLTHISSSPAEKPTQDSDIPDTQRNTQIEGSEELVSSQAHGSHGIFYRSQTPSFGSQISHTPAVPPFNSAPSMVVSKSHPTGMANLLNDSSVEPVSSQSCEINIDHLYIEGALNRFVDGTSGCSIEQLEQINRELMNELWQLRGEWNRNKVMSRLMTMFNETIRDIEEIQKIISINQSDLDMNHAL